MKKYPFSVVFAALILAGFIIVLLMNFLPLWFIRAFPIFASPSLVLNAWNKKYGALSSEFNKLKAVEERQSYIPLPVLFGDPATGTVQEDPLPLISGHLYLQKPGIIRKHLYLQKPAIIEILGPRGVGKSTLAFQIARDPGRRMLPILIDEETTDLAETIKAKLEGWLRVKIRPRVLKNLLRSRCLLVIVDNLSARSPETQEHLRTFHNKHPVNALIITSEYPAKFQGDSLKVYPQTIPPRQLLSFITRVLAKQESEALHLLEDQIALAENVASRLTQQRTARTTPLLVTLAVQNAIEHAEYTGSSITPQPETPTRGVGEPSEMTAPIVLEWVKIRNFKNIEHLDLDFTEPSALDGNWTCIAGINGAGKTSILQAICLLLLGKELVQQLGGDLLKRMLRRVGDQCKDATLRAGVRQGDQKYTLYLPLSERFVNAVDEAKLQGHTGYEGMVYIWERLRHQVFVSYGASRNLSDHKDTRHKDKSLHARQQMTLFDPLTQIASVDILLEGGSDAIAPLDTLHRLLKIILREELTVEDPGESEANKLFFTLKGTDGEQDTHIEAIDLPDGFRSTVAWLADLCSAWHQSLPKSEEKDRDPEKITGIVLLDEINLHLHPGLERVLVPRLRKALPNVQFIVTTHSPLVLASFDRDELVVLDKDQPGGKRKVDRQIFGMTMNDIYDYLMDVEPKSIVLDEMLEDEDTDQDLIKYLYQSKTVNEEDAEHLLEERKAMVRALRGEEKA